MNTRGSFRLFRLFGIDVSMHWTWLLVAYYQFQMRGHRYEGNAAWAVAEYLALFAIVLVHEFGHALACKSVGGIATNILLWPFGGIAFVQPPPRAGALLWSIVAGPLVNVVLLPVFGFLYLGTNLGGHVGEFVKMLWLINLMLLVFNLLPIYPLDGGQIVRAVLWFFVGRARSLLVAATIGLLGAAGIVILALSYREWWLLLLATLGAMQSLAGFQQARVMLRMMKAPHYSGVACPACGEAPPAGPFWRCAACAQPMDHFAQGAVCPRCGRIAELTPCPACGTTHPIHAWYAGQLQTMAAQRPVIYQPYTPPPPVGPGSVPGFDRTA
jgi:Zn-dependent protease